MPTAPTTLSPSCTEDNEAVAELRCAIAAAICGGPDAVIEALRRHVLATIDVLAETSDWLASLIGGAR